MAVVMVRPEGRPIKPRAERARLVPSLRTLVLSSRRSPGQQRPGDGTSYPLAHGRHEANP
jgi:hypothetical protein